MREHLVDLSNLDAVRQLRRPMLLALTRDISDPNFMPVTRDLSEAKRAAIIRWLEQLPAVGDDLPPATTDAGVGVGMPTGTAEVAAMDDDPLRFDVKNASAVETGQQVMARHTSRIADNGEK
jgi:hypothetical protein